MDPLEIGIILVQMAKIYQLFSETTKDLTPEQQEALWQRTVSRAKQAREIWEKA